VDRERRLSTARNHTATHLLHKALREVLGEHAHQSGSLVEPDRFRFDFTHFEGMNPDQLDDVERRVNRKIRENLTVTKSVSSLESAKAMGATALFSEKYGDTVRVIRIADYSMELCGGTHLDATGEIGFFRILKEEGIAAGVRRIEAVTGEAAEILIKEEQCILRELGGMLKASESDLPARVQALFDEKKDLDRRLKKAASSGFDPNAMLAKAVDVKGVRVLAAKVEAENADELKALGDRLRDAVKSGVIVLGAAIDDKASLLCVVTEDLVKSKSLKAGDIIKAVAQIVQGSGGGKPTFALAGGKDPSKLDEAMQAVAGIVEGFIK
jgi:alanyl-tRNA synthetase